MKNFLTCVLIAVGATQSPAQTNVFPNSGSVGIGTAAPSEQLELTAAQSVNMKQYAYAHFGSDYSAWSTIVGNNVRARRGQNDGMELASSSVNLGASAIRLNWGVMEFHVAAPANISSSTEGTPFSFPRMVISGTGNVGIGTVSPIARLDVGGAGSGNLAVRLTPDFGRVRFNGIDLLGYSASDLWEISNSDVAGFIIGTSWDWDRQVALRYSPGTIGAAGGILTVGQTDKNNVNYTHGVTRFFTNGVERLRVDPAGNVGIGTTSPTHKLAVNGTIRAKEVIVDTGWADHVFAADYRLAPLSEVEQHIQQRGHLPDVPSAADVAARGVSVGEMQKILLQKIEELTLHVIRLEKGNASLRADVSTLKAQAR